MSCLPFPTTNQYDGVTKTTCLTQPYKLAAHHANTYITAVFRGCKLWNENLCSIKVASTRIVEVSENNIRKKGETCWS